MTNLLLGALLACALLILAGNMKGKEVLKKIMDTIETLTQKVEDNTKLIEAQNTLIEKVAGETEQSVALIKELKDKYPSDEKIAALSAALDRQKELIDAGTAGLVKADELVEDAPAPEGDA